jgi:putative ABC transport system permease protein
VLTLTLALQTIRARLGGFAASFFAVFLGAAILMAFSSMLDTRAGGEVDPASADTLFIVATVVGGWGLLIVAFAVASTLTLSVRQRGQEIALLRSVGATPAQVRRKIVGEGAVLALVAAFAAIPPAMLAGRLLLELLQDSGQVEPAVGYRFGPIALSLGLGITLLAASIAALVTARRAAGMTSAESVRAASLDDAGMSKKRIAAAVFFLLLGLNMAVVTATVMDGKGIDAMQTAGQASIHAAIGLALLAPLLVRVVTARLAIPLARAGASGYLAAENMRRRTQQMASALVPIVLFTGVATGTLLMQSIENGAPTDANTSTTVADARNIETLNYVVVGMIAAFAAIMLVNSVVAATLYRRREFAQLRLAGSTPPQVLRMVSFESVVLLATGIAFGSLAAAFTVLPYGIARTDSIFPSSGSSIYLGVVGSAAILAISAALLAARRALRVRPVEAVHT